MIEFHLDSRSGVSPYLQIVQQVRQALRLGLLREGDQLPTVKEVVAQLAINPNTVLKAYRELEHQGLAGARPASAPSSPEPRRRVDRRPGPLRTPCRAGSSRLAGPGSTTRASRRSSATPFGPLPRKT